MVGTYIFYIQSVGYCSGLWSQSVICNVKVQCFDNPSIHPCFLHLIVSSVIIITMTTGGRSHNKLSITSCLYKQTDFLSFVLLLFFREASLKTYIFIKKLNICTGSDEWYTHLEKEISKTATSLLFECNSMNVEFFYIDAV